MQVVAPAALHWQLSTTNESARRVKNPKQQPNQVKMSSTGRRLRIKASAASTAARVGADIGAKYFETDQRPVILYDGVCNLCNGAVNFMLDWDGAAVFRMAALQSDAGKQLLQRSGRAPDDISSIVLVENDASYIKSEAILRIGAKLALPISLLSYLGFPIPLLIRDFAYDQVANNRYSFLGRRDVCRLRDPRFDDRFLVE